MKESDTPIGRYRASSSQTVMQSFPYPPPGGGQYDDAGSDTPWTPRGGGEERTQACPVAHRPRTPSTMRAPMSPARPTCLAPRGWLSPSATIERCQSDDLSNDLRPNERTTCPSPFSTHATSHPISSPTDLRASRDHAIALARLVTCPTLAFVETATDDVSSRVPVHQNCSDTTDEDPATYLDSNRCDQPITPSFDRLKTVLPSSPETSSLF
jgi:hypothetical protein